MFEPNNCFIYNAYGSIVFIGKIVNNIYQLDLHHASFNIHCLLTKEDDTWLWHRRLCHIHMQHFNRLYRKQLVEGLPKLKFEKDRMCEACQKGKQTKVSFKPKNVVSTQRPLEMLHMDLFGPSRTMSLGGNVYALIIVDDFSRYTWTLFLVVKNDTFHAFKRLVKMLENEKSSKIEFIQSDHGREFQNERFEHFGEKHGIKHNFSAPRIPQQNGVVERKNMSLEELARTMLNEYSLPKYFWADVVNTACYVLNRVLIRPILKKTKPYELFKGMRPILSHLKVFGCKCFILNNGKEIFGKFYAKANEGVFLGYATQSHAYRVYNKILMIVEESMHVVFDETNPKLQDHVPKIAYEEETAQEKQTATKLESAAGNQLAKNEIQSTEKAADNNLPKEWIEPRGLSKDNIIGGIEHGVSTRRKLAFFQHVAFVSQIEPKNVNDALCDSNWVVAMQDELNQFTRNDVLSLVPKIDVMNAIGTKWVFKNKMDENGNIIRNEARLVAKGYSQEEDIDFDETYALVARLEAMRLLLAYACMCNFKLSQMDVKSEFLNGFLNEEVYASQPPGFEDHLYPNHVFKLKKALYGLKQAP